MENNNIWFFFLSLKLVYFKLIFYCLFILKEILILVVLKICLWLIKFKVNLYYLYGMEEFVVMWKLFLLVYKIFFLFIVIFWYLVDILFGMFFGVNCDVCCKFGVGVSEFFMIRV